MAARLAVGAMVAGVLFTVHAAAPGLWKHPIPAWSERTWQSWRVMETVAGWVGAEVAVSYDVVAPALGYAWIGLGLALFVGGRGRPR
jgi:hypothetical protein